MAEGTSFTTKDEDFVSSPDLDFHPTDVIEDADGSLLIVDTGGWYKLCCPTSQLHKPDVLGAIYRIRRTGAAKVEDPWGTKLAALTRDLENSVNQKAVVELLGDPRPGVQRRAIEGLAKARENGAILASTPHGLPQAIPLPSFAATASGLSPALTVLPRESLVRDFLSDADDDVRQVAVHVTSLTRDREAVPRLIELLESASFPNRRGRRGAGTNRRSVGCASALEGRWPFR